MRVGYRVAVLLFALSCAPSVRERCRLVTEDIAPPPIPFAFLEPDRLLIQRARATMSSGWVAHVRGPWMKSNHS